MPCQAKTRTSPSTPRPSIRAKCSTWSSHALGVPSNAVTVEIRRMGGGFGGKETQGNQFAALAAIAAKKHRRAVKIRPDRDDDMITTGKRHDFVIDYEVGFDEDGNIHGVDFMFAARCGFSADLSGPVTDRALFHCDNAYFWPAVHAQSAPLYTNTVSNTAFRGFGGPQGMVGAERVIEEIAFAVGKDPLEIRKLNFYGTTKTRNVTPYHQTVEDNIIHRIVAELEESSDYARRRRTIAAFNDNSRYREARHRADAGEVRHLLHRHALQPGRRAGACLHRRLGASEPRRHRDGAGPLPQGRAGGGRRVPDRPRPGEDHRDDDRQGAEHLGDRRLLRLRPQRHGGAERGAADQGAAHRLRRRQIPGAARTGRVPAQPGAHRQPGDRLRRPRQAGLSGAHPALRRRLLQDAEHPLEPRQGRRAGHSTISPMARPARKCRSTR